MSESIPVPSPSSVNAERSVNTWFLALPAPRRDVLREDKWMLAQAAYVAGAQEGAREAALTPPVLAAFEVSYFSTVDWRTITAEIIARDEVQARAWADAQCPSEFRCKIRRDSNTGETSVDTLKIERLRPVDLPILIRSNP